MKKKRRKSRKRSDRHQAKLPFARAVKARRRCACNGRCCRSPGVKCGCRCHGRNHGSKVVHRNPPSRPLRLRMGVLGIVESITYRRGGKRWRHNVEGKARLLVPADGSSYIAIDGIKVSRFLEG